MYLDSHAHISSDALFEQIEDLRKRASLAGVEGIVNICTDEKTLKRGVLLKGGSPEVVLTASTTPHDVEKEGESFFPKVKEAAKKGLLSAIGETGLDYYYEYSPKELQKKYLIKYFNLATEMNLPVVFHCRDAFEDLFAIAKIEYAKGPALLHCFTGTLEEAKKVIDLGWYISFSGIITFKKSYELREVVKYVPLDRMMIETDSPYLAPQSKRGKVNEPSFITETAALVAELKGVSVEEVAKQTKVNARTFFSF
jgi:TatD DNase family protein